MNDTSVDEMLRPVRVYTDIPQSLDIALKISCAKLGKTRKEYIAEILREYLTAEGATAAGKLQRKQKKG